MYQTGPLPRRSFLGLQLESARAAPGADGVRVVNVFHASAASRADVRVGDRLLAIDGSTVSDAARAAEAARRVRSGERVAFRVERDGRPIHLEGEAPAFPVERMDEGEVLLAHVSVGASRLRTVYAIPHGEERHPAILYLQGVRAESCEVPFHPASALFRLVRSWVRAGFVVMRVERSGVGDSEGPSPRTTDLGVELDGYAAALADLQGFEGVASDRVFLFGHSLGGMVAPLVANARSVAGVTVFGTSARRWHDCTIESARRQRILSGLRGGALDEEMARRTELGVKIYREGATPADVFARCPDLSSLQSHDCEGDTLYGRHVRFFQQLEAVDLAAAWRTVGAKVQIAHGAYDWICSEEEAREIASAVGSEAGLDVLHRIGHDMLAHDSLEASFRSAERGQWDGQVADATRAWLDAQAITSSHPPGNMHP